MELEDMVQRFNIDHERERSHSNHRTEQKTNLK